MKVGILGGTFDPIHLGHLLMAESAREILELRQVLFVPAGDPPHKQELPITPACHRQAMVELALAHNPFFELSPVDLDRSGPHYSTETVQLLQKQYDLPPELCYFIIGSDSLQDLPTWHRPAELIKICRLAVARRPGSLPDLTSLEASLPGLSDQLTWVEMPLVGISASDIRARARAGQSIRYQVPDGVGEYIQKHQLYRKIQNQRLFDH
jgi:nicotinate-nucleotide adenylyltransferase